MRVNILIGGKAGQGPNIVSQLVGEALVPRGYYVFMSRDYESVIRGGHNFNVLTFSDKETRSNDSEIDILVCFDDNTEKIHRKNLKKSGILLKGSSENMYYAGKIFKILGFKFELLEEQLKKLRNFDENLKNAKKGYEEEKKTIKISSTREKKTYFYNGSQGIAMGSIKSGLDLYYAYPMTPATPLLFELASLQEKNNFITIELENEIAVINAAIGSAATGAKSMVGTSGGGFDLMTEALSFAGQAEIPLVCYLASRPGPSTGVATYTSQGDLNLARHCGHGEFFRLVLAPGTPDEAQELVSQAFYFTQKYKTQAIVLSDKHLAESFFTLEHEPRIIKSEKSTKLIRYSSYEHTGTGEATENAEIIKKNVERRLKKAREIEKEAQKFAQYKVYGKKDSKNLIIGWGSTKGAILDAIEGLDAKFLQILYLEPFSEKIADELKKAKKIVIVENNSTSQLSQLVAEKTGIFIEDKNKILRYDGRPFLSDELSAEIKRRLR
jgi:2-oxoglutarate ferredoxin oxidoreductase subunit alpha